MENLQRNGVVLNCNKMTIKFRSSDLHYKVSPGIVAKGYVEADFNTVDIGFGLGFKTQTSPDGRQLMAVESVSVIVDIIKDDVELHIGGSFATDMANIIKPIIRGIVCDEIVSNLKMALQKTAPNAINKQLVANNGYAQIIPNLWWDWESPEAAKVTTETFQFATKGLMFDNRTGEVDPGVAPPTMPAKVASNPAKFQLFVSTYAIDSFFYALPSVFDHAIIWINSTDANPIPTTRLDALIPGLSKHYGANQTVNIGIKIESIDNVTVSGSQNKMGAKFTAQLQFWVNTVTGTVEEAAAMTLIDTVFEFTALI